MAVNDRLYPVRGSVKAVDRESGTVLFDGSVEIPANGTVCLSQRLPLKAAQGCIRIDYEFEGIRRVNKCLYGYPPFDCAKVVEWRK